MPTKNNYAQWPDSFERNSRDDTLETTFRPRRSRSASRSAGSRPPDGPEGGSEDAPSYRVLAPESQSPKEAQNKLDNRTSGGWLEPEPIFDDEDVAPNSSPADALLDDDVLDDDVLDDNVLDNDVADDLEDAVDDLEDRALYNNGYYDDDRHDDGYYDNDRHDDGYYDNGRHDNDRYDDDGMYASDVASASETHASATHLRYQDDTSAVTIGAAETDVANTDHPRSASHPYRRRINLVDGLVSAYVIIMTVWLIREMFLR